MPLLGKAIIEINTWHHENPAVVTWLQKMRLIQRPLDHAKHHTKPETRAYCTYTPWLNPVLDGIGFWVGIENFFSLLGGHTTDRID